MAPPVEYPGNELAAMAAAGNYYRWIFNQFRPFIGRRILEVGAGLGTFSSHLLDCQPDQLWLIEPAPNLVTHLQARFVSYTTVRVLQGDLLDAQEVLASNVVDTIISVNVLEHIEDDQSALQIMKELLSNKGHLLLFVPALPCLYNSLDAAFGHHRRYRKQDLMHKLTAAGLLPIHSRYVNMIGMLGWWYSGAVRKQRNLSVSAVGFYDRYVIPATMALESRLSPPYGQSLLAIARAG